MIIRLTENDIYRMVKNVILEVIDSRHYAEERQERERVIRDIIGDTNNVICVNIMNRGHVMGPERFELSDMCVMRVYNAKTNVHITSFLPTPHQLYQRLGDEFMKLPPEEREHLVTLAKIYQELRLCR